eukprot:6040484-Pyramimonas_sp.AAC.1
MPVCIAYTLRCAVRYWIQLLSASGLTRSMAIVTSSPSTVCVAYALRCDSPAAPPELLCPLCLSSFVLVLCSWQGERARLSIAVPARSDSSL